MGKSAEKLTPPPDHFHRRLNELCGADKWLLKKHGTKARRSWRKLHIGMDADTGQIVTALLITNDVDDGSQVGPLLNQVTTSVASYTADGAYDQEGVAAAVTEPHPGTLIIVPPRSTAVQARRLKPHWRSGTATLRCITEHG